MKIQKLTKACLKEKFVIDFKSFLISFFSFSFSIVVGLRKLITVRFTAPRSIFEDHLPLHVPTLQHP